MTTTPLWPQEWSYDDATGLVTITGQEAPNPNDPDPMAAASRPRATFQLSFPADLTLTPPQED